MAIRPVEMGNAVVCQTLPGGAIVRAIIKPARYAYGDYEQSPGRRSLQLKRSRKSSYWKRRTHSSASVSESHSQIEGSGTPLNVVVFTIE